MKNKSLWTISVSTSPEAEEAISELLQDLLRQPAVSYTDVETGRTSVTSYLSTRPDWPQLQRKLSRGLAGIRDCGLKIAPGRVSFQKIRREDWAESWKRHFRPIEIGSALLIKPGWNRRRPRKGQAVIILDPGLSFGTGQHPTTAFCLEQLAERRNRGTRQSFLDIGTGSGILAIAAAKLGYSPIEALDNDPASVRIARSNASRNRVPAKVRFRQVDLTKLRRPGRYRYDLICANLTSDLLVSEAKRITARLRAAGILVLAGILKAEFGTVQRAYESAGLRLMAEHKGKEWRSGAFQFRRP